MLSFGNLCAFLLPLAAASSCCCMRLLSRAFVEELMELACCCCCCCCWCWAAAIEARRVLSCCCWCMAARVLDLSEAAAVELVVVGVVVVVVVEEEEVSRPRDCCERRACTAAWRAAWLEEEEEVALEWLEVVLEAELSEEGEVGEPMDLPATWPALGSNSFSFMADILKRGGFVSLGFFCGDGECVSGHFWLGLVY